MSRKILLADDSVTAQNMGRRILSDAGYEVVTVNNGPAALKKLAEQKPDLVILDVYMPGYGGLEVCQRIKESEETSRIPVLLTVGKLEPFKADEARRVRADAHLVKPFEATELLAALIKLEERIVPQSGGIRIAGKAAKEKAGTGKERKFGDTDTGWKQRLTIPAPAVRTEQPPEVEPSQQEETPSTAFREFSRSEGQQQEAAAPAIRGQIPGDITAEEIAAIAAAAEAFDQHAPVAEPSAPASEFGAEEIPPASHAAADPVEEAPQPAFEAAENPPAVAEEIPPVFEAIAPAMEADIANPEPEVAAAPPEVATDSEVAAVLESLAPADGIAAMARESEIAERAAAHADLPEEAVARAGSGWRSAVGPRWIAEEVSVSGNEASLILEQEMQKAYAATAELAPPPMSWEEASAAIMAATEDENAERAAGGGEQIFSAYSDLIARAQQSGASVEQPASAAFDGQEPEAVAMAQQSNASAPEDAAPPEMAGLGNGISIVEAEQPDAVAEAASDVASVNEMPAAEAMTASADQLEPTGFHEESAYAAAAAASSDFHPIRRIEAVSATTDPAETRDSAPASPAAEANPEHEAELAAAWAHWRQIRESIASPQFASQLADAAAEGYKEIRQMGSVAPEMEGDPSAADRSTADQASGDHASSVAAADPSAIASIVDSMLAELKPKLVEEIAKKLSRERKK